MRTAGCGSRARNALQEEKLKATFEDRGALEVEDQATPDCSESNQGPRSEQYAGVFRDAVFDAVEWRLRVGHAASLEWLEDTFVELVSWAVDDWAAFRVFEFNDGGAVVAMSTTQGQIVGDIFSGESSRTEDNV